MLQTQLGHPSLGHGGQEAAQAPLGPEPEPADACRQGPGPRRSRCFSLRRHQRTRRCLRSRHR